ncbi:hypothetical protein PILCRDRAFT_776312 [Piloderma croceum F 1598]|uniref:Spindle pole body component n=1 Tax=Piloderma croceum (strain F 1598) TaxID=765440 RepID=A0A0C3FPU5_PILCF|nr:hypothetical protein PILCRDRAFT_776312 [Piloderma croceum F 1598]
MGSEVLTNIYEQMQNMSSDPAAHALYSRLFRACEPPYMAMIRAWTAHGQLVDPYDEFCVTENKFINRGTLEVDFTDEYREERYTLRDGSMPHISAAKHHAGTHRSRPASVRLRGGACIPPLLEGWKHKILLAGKYLIRECGIEIPFFKPISLPAVFLTSLAAGLWNEVDQNQMCFEEGLSMNDEKHFLDLSHAELRKSTQSASIIKLQSFLDLALSTDLAGFHKESGGVDDVVFRKNLKVTMAESGLYEWLLKVVNVSGLTETAASGHKIKEKDNKKPTLAIDALALDYTVKSPLPLVIARNIIHRYQLLSQFLLQLKRVEQSLLSMWTDHKGTPWRKAAPNHSELASFRAVDSGVCNVRGARAQLASARNQTGECNDGRPVVRLPHGFPGYMFEGMHVDKLEAA